jgi:hypothetical protein
MEPSNDGSTILQAYQNGWNPHQTNTPPAPAGLAVKYYGQSPNLIITWNPNPGAVTGYVVGVSSWASSGTNLTSVASNQTILVDNLSSIWFQPAFPPNYQVKALYAAGPSPWSDIVSIYAPDLSPQVPLGQYPNSSLNGDDSKDVARLSVVRGPQGHLFLVTGHLPPGVATLRVWAEPYGPTWYPITGEGNYLTEDPQQFTNFTATNYWETSASSLQAGFIQLPASLVQPYQSYSFRIQTVAADGRVADCAQVFGSQSDDWRFETEGILAAPFLDGRQHIQQNVEFQLRAAEGSAWDPDPDLGFTNQVPFAVGQLICFGGDPWSFGESAATNYVSAGFHYFYPASWGGWGLVFDPLRPFEQNYFYANFLWAGPPWGPVTWGDSEHCDPNPPWDLAPRNIPYPGNLQQYEVDLPWSRFSASVFAAAGLTNPPSAVVTPSAAQWIYMTDPADYGDALWTFAAASRNDPHTVYADFPNLYGLRLLSVKAAPQFSIWTGPQPQYVTAYPGQTFANTNFAYFFNVERPALLTVGYYFARTRAVPAQLGTTNLDARPGEPGFSPTNTTPLIIAPVGVPLFLTAWTKQAITNGYASKFAYPEQYFDKAFKIDANGNTTTNQTGILSPYGEFFPTEPGPVALTTMPDGATASTGTGVVNVIKLQLDVNHDGVMDLSFGGPDNTSQRNPFTFWINNDFDRWHHIIEIDWNDIVDEEEDDLVSADCPANPRHTTPDCDYQWATDAYAIPSKRDLEDYTRLWLPGLKKLWESHTNLTLELSIRNNDTTDGPAINLVLASESDGGTRYLTDTNVAKDQISLPSGKCLGRVGPGSPLELTQFFRLALYPGTGAEHFIWCGARRGKGELLLRVRSGTNILAETSTWLDLKDVKEMYERWTVGDIGSRDPASQAYLALEDLPRAVAAFQYGSSETTNTPYILHAHGWNMSRHDKDRYAETAFKRLYWQGYQGKFGSFRWPTRTGFTTFDASEFNAWKSASGLYRLITNLSAQYSGALYLTAHSMGNIVVGEALRLAGPGTPVDTYIAMQAAIASHAYDPSTTNRSLGIFDSYTYDRHAEYWTTGAPCYLNAIKGAKHFATGAQTNVAGPFNLSAQVDLDGAYGFGDLHKGHSAEFRSTNMDRWPFWDQVLFTMGLKTAQ